MRQLRKSTATATVALAALALLAAPTIAAGDQTTANSIAAVQLAGGNHGQGGQGGEAGHGTGGQDMMGAGTRATSATPGMMGPGFGGQVVPGHDLSPDGVRHFLEHGLEMHGDQRLKVGEVKPAGDDRILADITTHDGALVQRLQVDRHSGQMMRVN